MGDISSVVSMECESVTTADSGWGEEFITAVVDLYVSYFPTAMTLCIMKMASTTA